jgi:hypothetical protein
MHEWPGNRLAHLRLLTLANLLSCRARSNKAWSMTVCKSTLLSREFVALSRTAVQRRVSTEHCSPCKTSAQLMPEPTNLHTFHSLSLGSTRYSQSVRAIHNGPLAILTRCRANVRIHVEPGYCAICTALKSSTQMPCYSV